MRICKDKGEIWIGDNKVMRIPRHYFSKDASQEDKLVLLECILMLANVEDGKQGTIVLPVGFEFKFTEPKTQAVNNYTTNLVFPNVNHVERVGDILIATTKGVA
jgi:hypothetical protein